jgi:gliding motility-associated-like protein
MVTIVWKESPTLPVDNYWVYELFDDLITNKRYKEESPNTFKTTFSYPKVKRQPVKFWIAAFRSPDKYSNNNGYYHQTIFTQCSYDSCNMNVTIKWTKYVGWGNNLDYYQAWKIVNGTTNPEQIGGKMSSNDTTLTIPVEPNKNYCFYVCAVNKDATITSYSNDTCFLTKSNNAPAFIKANASFEPNSKGPVKLQFDIDHSSQLTKYQLFVSDLADGTFEPMNAPFTAGSIPILVQDNTIGLTPRYYRLDALNFCGHSITQSNIATAIIPKLKAQSNEVNLIWNEYKGWYQGVARYNIYRKIGEDDAVKITNPVETDNSFTDNLSVLAGQQYSGNICYYVEAESNRDSEGNVFRSISSANCIDLSESVLVPTGFTPNGDMLNDEFKPSFAFLPKEYTMVVYNRYGFKVFEMKQQFHGIKGEVVNGWDGSISGGQRAPEGTYVYLIKFVTPAGKTVERNGSFSLIYP